MQVVKAIDDDARLTVGADPPPAGKPTGSKKTGNNALKMHVAAAAGDTLGCWAALNR